jgi:hypothetical protein
MNPMSFERKRDSFKSPSSSNVENHPSMRQTAHFPRSILKINS